MRTLIIGDGEIGRSLYNALKDTHETEIRDTEEYDLMMDKVDVLNICYPPSDTFVTDTLDYIGRYQPSVVIVHSTVAPGTTRQLGDNAVHSPVHGKHPNLTEGIRTFVKYVGAVNRESAEVAKAFLEEAGITTKIVSSPEASELSKILCTTYYGWNIVFMKEVARICEEYEVPFDEVYTQWNKFYNEGYTELGMEQFVRPVLKNMPGKIGGHCVVNNTHLLDSMVTNLIKEKDEEYE